MALSSEVSRIDYTGSGGQATYSFPFKTDASADLLLTTQSTASPPVYTTLVLTTDYTVSLNANQESTPGGSITLVAGNLSLNVLLTIRRDPAQTQATDLRNQGSFYGATVEARLDKLTMMVQALSDLADRSLKLAETEVGTTTKTRMPDATTRASKVLGWDGSGNPTATTLATTVLSVSGYIQTLLDDADAATARNTLGATAGKWGSSHLADESVTAAILANAVSPQLFQARLTLLSATPVTTADQTSKTTLYLTPYNGNKLGLYDGSARWKIHTLTEINVAVPNTASTMYDCFVWDNAGTLTLDAVAWTNDTTRATALATQDGVLVKTGATARRYCGSFRTTTVSGNTEDSFSKRFLWNYSNRVPRAMLVTDATDTWNYTTDTYRQARATATNQVDFIIGVAEVPLVARVRGAFQNTSAGVRASVGIGIDSTSVNSASLTSGGESSAANEFMHLIAEYTAYPAVGKHSVVWLEKSEATGTTSFIGDLGLTAGSILNGLSAEVMG